MKEVVWEKSTWSQVTVCSLNWLWLTAASDNRESNQLPLIEGELLCVAVDTCVMWSK